MAGEGEIELFGDEGAIRVDHEDDLAHHFVEDRLDGGFVLLLREGDFAHLEVEGAEIVIDEVVEDARGGEEVVFVHLRLHLLDGGL